MKTPPTRRPSKEQSVADLPPFDWQVVVVRPHPSTMAGSYIARRYRVAPGLADTIAALAGLGNEMRS